MQDTGNFIEVKDIDDSIRQAITEEESNAFELMGINKNSAPKDIINQIRQHIDLLIANGSLIDKNDQELTNLAVTLGAAWGEAVCKTYNWRWQGLRREDENDAAFYIVSPSSRFCCPPFGMVFNILKGENIGLDGKTDNTILLLFNMLDGVESQKTPHNYMVLM